MSANKNEAVQRQRELLYADKTNEQLIMIALHNLIAATDAGSSALMYELYDRYSRLDDETTAKNGKGRR